MSLRHQVLFTSCMLAGFALNAGTAKAGFMEGIVDSVFRTAEQEFLGTFTRKSQPTHCEPQRKPTPSAAAPSRAMPSPSVQRRTWFSSPRLFRGR